MPSDTPADHHRFGRYALLPARRALLVDGREARIGGRAFDLLLALVEHRDRIVTKDELLQRVWPGRVVEEGNLTVHVAALRKLLGGGVIATASGRGYRFVAPLVDAGAAPSPAPAADPDATPGQGPASLPRPLTRLIGREADLQAVLALLAPSRSSGRLVTLLGPGGIGKTRLALEVADQAAAGLPDGVWLAELGPLADPAALPLAVARAPGRDLRNFASRPAIPPWLAPR
ncbi:winged helix-turn-helix domain-containing protein, partial [Teichococcus deserti]|uniref:winged helix-turn-helix domain-containing protein n=1 Tax=Teichococcus deserti TaxID=1817963 RepID=UPI0013F61699